MLENPKDVGESSAGGSPAYTIGLCDALIHGTHGLTPPTPERLAPWFEALLGSLDVEPVTPQRGFK